MTHFLYIFLVLFCFTFLEVFFGTYGVIIPFIATGVFYLSVVYDVKAGIIVALLAGGILDVLYGRAYCISPITLTIVSLLALFWIRKSNLKNLLLQMIPGAAISFIYAAPVLLVKYSLYEGGGIIFFINVLVLLLAMIAGAILLPTIIITLDAINKKLRINTYVNSAKRLNESP